MVAIILLPTVCNIKILKYGWCADVENYTMTSTGEVTISVQQNKKVAINESMGAGFFEAGGYIVTAYRIF